MSFLQSIAVCVVFSLLGKTSAIQMKANLDPSAGHSEDGDEEGTSGALSKLVIGFHTSSVKQYTEMVTAQFETWLADFPKDRVLVAGGPRDNVGAAPGGPCPDDHDQTCKDAAIFYAAAQKVAETSSEWFMGVHEDAYVRLDLVAKALPLSAYDTERPVIFTGVGCGRGWQYNEQSNNGTLPFPKGWVEPSFSCHSVWEHGGLCTGAAYLINRAALLKVTRAEGGEHLGVESFIKKYMSHWQSTTEPASRGTDRLLGCVLGDHGVAMEAEPHAFLPKQVYDITEGWQGRSDELKHDAAIYNVEGAAGTLGVDHSGRERIPTFHREAHAFFASKHKSSTLP